MGVELTAFLKDTFYSLRNPSYWLLTTWFKFLMRYRKMYVGPIWIILGPLAFIFFLGSLFAGYGSIAVEEFIPHLSIGFIVWTLIGGYLLQGPMVYLSNRSNLLLEKSRHTDIIFLDNAQLIIHFLHQAVIMVGVCLVYGTIKGPYALMSLVGLLIIIINGYWISFVFGFIGARLKDFREVMRPVARVTFFATPIIWMPKDTAGGTKGIFQIYIDFNPFNHFLQIVRAPLLNQEIEALTWYVVFSITVLGYLLASVLYWRYRNLIVYWV